MNPWWIYFWSRVASKIPKSYCPSCGLPLNPSKDLDDPLHALCNHCHTEMYIAILPEGKKKGS